MNSSEERVVVVDERNAVVGSATRAEMRRLRLPHRAAYVLVLNGSGKLLVHKRTATKDVYPGCYDVAAGGVVRAGETYEENAARELEEELGIRGAPLTALFDFYHEDAGNRVWGRAFSCTWDGPLTLQAEEVESASFLSPAEAEALAAREAFTPDGLLLLRRFLGRAP